MADLNTKSKEELVIDRVIRSFGFEENDLSKYIVIRIALAWALNAKKIPLESPQWKEKELKGDKGKEYRLEQITNKDKGKEDFDLLVRALIYIKHKEELDRDKINIFEDGEKYLDILRKYIKRGFYELDNSYKSKDCIYQWCLDNLNLNITNSQSLSMQENTLEGEYFSKLKNYFKKEGIDIEPIREFPSYRHYICKIRIVDSTKIQAFERKKEYLKNEFGCEVLVESISGVNRGYSIQIAKSKNEWKILGLKKFKEGLDGLKDRDDKLKIYAGNDIEDKAEYFDLAECPHCFVAGTSGSGKTKFLQTMIICLLQNKDVEITVIDPKQGIEFKIFDKKINLIVNMKEVERVLEDAINEMNMRNTKMSESSVNNIESLGLKYKVIIIDELNNLINTNKILKDKLAQLAEMARQAGIHLVLGTQRPDGVLLKGLRNNIDGNIALKVRDSNESKIILDESGAEKLLGSGDMLVKLNNMPSPKHILAPYLENEEIENLIKSI